MQKKMQIRQYSCQKGLCWVFIVTLFAEPSIEVGIEIPTFCVILRMMSVFDAIAMAFFFYVSVVQVCKRNIIRFRQDFLFPFTAGGNQKSVLHQLQAPSDFSPPENCKSGWQRMLLKIE